MQDEGTAPRIDADNLSQYQGSTVRVVGRVLQADSNRAVLGCGEQGATHVHVTMVPGQQYNSTFVEVMGVVSPENVVEEIVSYDLGDKFDLVNYQRMLELAHGKYKHLFAGH